MHYQEIYKLFGYSEFSPEIKELLPKLDIPLDRPESSLVWRKFHSLKWDFFLTFVGKNIYKQNIGPVPKEYIIDYDEDVLEEINFGEMRKGLSYPYPMPFDLKFGEISDIVKQKIGIKNPETVKNIEGFLMIFNTQNHKVYAFFDFNNKLTCFRVRPHEISFIQKRDMAKKLKQQNKNLTISNIEDLKSLKQESPLNAWIKRFQEGDLNFTTKSLEDAKLLLNTFIDNLILASEQKKANAVYSAVRIITKSFNKLNEKHRCFIETLEAEELVEYIHSAVQKTGFKIEEDLDLTEEWREW